MPDESAVSITIETGPVEIVECGDELLVRVPLLVDGKEIGDIILASEDDAL